MKRFLRIGLALFVGVGLIGPAAAVPRPPVTSNGAGDVDLLADKGWIGPRALVRGPVQAMVELSDAPAADVYSAGVARGLGEQQLTSATRSQQAQIDAAQQRFVNQVSALNATVIYRAQRVYNGVAITVDASKLGSIARMAGVKGLYPLVPKTLDNATSVPLISAQLAWNKNTASGKGTGKGIKVAVIDTGIDFVHKDFGGNGDYTGVSDTSAPKFNAKVVGGYDFAGDDYNANESGSTPKPDPNPFDCNGHGTHVSGTAVGYGVLKNGNTYTGPWNSSTKFSDFRIGPGVAPEASLYGLRVFGCEGSTNVVVPALEWALDPNGDGDFADKVDVVNMSLGSSYGSNYDADAVASNRLTAAGVIVVASAGNSGDSYFITGSPGSANNVISVASSFNSQAILDGVGVSPAVGGKSVLPAAFSVAYNWDAKAPVSGKLVYPDTQRTGCQAFNAQNTSVISGNVVLLDWTDNECGSVTRGGNAVRAGAKGFILVDNSDAFDLLITGSSVIPGVSMPKDIGKQLKDNIAKNLTITFDAKYRAATTYDISAYTDTLSSFSSRGASGSGGLKPDITAPGNNIFSALVGSGDKGESLNGTSMAAPHVAGAMAVLRQFYPTWTVAELKALAMNTATKDVRSEAAQNSTKYDPARSGAGRIDMNNATTQKTIAYDQDNPAGVSVSFGNVEVSSQATLTRTVVIENKGTVNRTYKLEYVAAATIPGVEYSLSSTSVAVKVGEKKTVVVTMTADPTKMKPTRASTVSATQGGLPRHSISEASGYVKMTNDLSQVLRLPVYAAPYPVANLTGATSTSLANLTQNVSGTVVLSGTGLTGTTPPTDTVAVATAFEWQVSSPQLDASNVLTSYADLQYVGIGSDYTAMKATASSTDPVTETTVYFGVSTFGDWTSPNIVEFDVYIDTNRDGTDDYALFSSNTGGTDPNDVFITKLVKLLPSGNIDSGFGVVPQSFINIVPADAIDTRPFRSNVLVLPVFAGDIGLTSAKSTFSYTVIAFDNLGGSYDIGDTATYNVARPGVSFTGGVANAPAYAATNGTTIPFTVDASAFATNKSKGILLLHHHNAKGKRAQVIDVSSSVQPSPAPGQAVWLPMINK